MATVQPNPAAARAQASDLWQGAAYGGLIGMFVGRPILGALGGMVYKLFTTDGLADAARTLFDPEGTLGSVLGGNDKARKTTTRRKQEEPASKPAVPGWLKALGIGAAVVAGVSALGDTMTYGFMGRPFFGGYGFGYPYYGW